MTQFQPGQSGNPVGRPKGSVNKQLKALREAAEEILPLVLERALAGDADAQKLIIERGVPRMKSITPAEPFTLPEGSLAQQMQALLQLVADGELSMSAATQAVGMVVATAKAKEIETQEVVKAALHTMAPMPTAQVGNAYLVALQARLIQR